MTATTIVAKLASGDSEGAVHFLLGRYDPTTQAHTIRSMFERCKRLYLKDPSNRRAKYEEDIRSLMDYLRPYTPDPDAEEDLRRLDRLLHASLLEQNQVYSTPKSPYLLDHEADVTLHAIRPACTVFYDFILPEPILRDAFNYAKEKRTARMLQSDGKQYNFTVADVDHMIRVARSELATNIVKPRNYFNVIAALGLLSGRRTYEIAKTLQYSPGPTPLQATVSGINKGHALKSEEFHTIPILTTYESFASAMDKLRAFRTVEGMCDDSPMASVRHGVAVATKRLFGRSLSHTQKRNLYSEMAYRDKENSGFMTQGCSKGAWVKLALCHDLIFPDPTSTYASMTIQ